MITHTIAFLAGALCAYLVQQWYRRRRKKYGIDPDWMEAWSKYR